MTHIDNIKALGNRMVTNLNAMGVSAEFNDGGITLADKILWIGKSLTLTADKEIVTTGDTVELTATYNDLLHPETIEGLTIQFINSATGDILATGLTDDAGVCTVSYSVQNTESLYIKAKCGIIVSKTYEICDAIKYIDEVTKTHSSSSVEWYNLADLGTNIGDCEISATLKSTNANGFRLDFANSNQYENKHRIVLGTYNTGYKFISRYDVNGTENDYSTQVSYIANTDLSVKIIRQNGNLTCSIDNINHTFSDLSNLRYIGLTLWSYAKTVTVTDLKVKPL